MSFDDPTGMPQAPDELTQIALRAGSGDKAALSRFIKETHTDCWRLLAHLGGSQYADDLTQETYLRVLKSLPSFAGRSTAKTWLLAIARRTWVDSVRHDQARPKKSVVEVETATVNAAQEHTVGDQQWAALADVRVLLDELEPERREALVLTQVLGYSYEDAAKIMGVRIGTVRSRVARARADLVQMSAGDEQVYKI